jgi:hypothetical protein
MDEQYRDGETDQHAHVLGPLKSKVAQIKSTLQSFLQKFKSGAALDWMDAIIIT